MAMTPMEVMRAAIRFEGPDRLPVLLGSLGYSDAVNVGFSHDSEWARTGEGLDEWGCRWRRVRGDNMGQPLGHPLLNYAQVANYPVSLPGV